MHVSRRLKTKLTDIHVVGLAFCDNLESTTTFRFCSRELETPMKTFV